MTEEAFAVELERAVEPSRALVPLTDAPGSSLSRRYRHNATIISQLIAVKLDVPQARERRRAGTEEGVAAYGATGDAIKVARRARGLSWGV